MAMKDDALGKLLSRESQKGVLDSSGTFTIGSSKKLRNYHRTDPDYYVKAWIRSAIIGGAQSVTVDSNVTEFSVSYEGTPFTLEQLGSLTDFVGAPLNPDRQLAEAALGIIASLQRGYREVRIVSWDGTTSHQLRFDTQQARIVSKPSQKAPGISFRTARAGLSGLLLDLKRRLLHRSESEMVGQCCTYSPIPIFLNGQPVQPPCISRMLLSGKRDEKEQLEKLAARQVITPTFEAYDRLIEVYLRPAAPCEGLLCSKLLGEVGGALTSPPHSRVQTVAEDWRKIPETSQENREGFLAILGVEVAMEALATLVWVRDGVVLGNSRLDLGCPGLVGVVAILGIDLDLGHAALVENEAYLAMLDFLRAQATRLREEVLGNLGRLPHRLGEHVRGALGL